MKKIVIIGGGAAGLMTAVAAAKELGNAPHSITVVEKNSRPARKVMITARADVTLQITATLTRLLHLPQKTESFCTRLLIISIRRIQ